MATTPGDIRAAKPKGGLKNMYLIAFNTVSVVAWLVVFWRGVFAFQQKGYAGVHGELGEFWTWTQTLALMEVVHSLLGVVRAPVLTTVMQVASRLLLVWGIIYPFPQLARYPTFSTMLLAHSITEIVRYGYFALTLSGQNPGILSWLRYNTFFVLYPLGIASEVSLIYAATAPAAKVDPRLPYVLYAIMAVYVPGSHILYSYMMKQRTKVMKGKASEKKIQ